MMTATLYLTQPDSGKILAARVVEIDHGGRIVGATFAAARLEDGTLSFDEALRRTGAAWHVVRDFGAGANAFRDRSGGFGWGGQGRLQSRWSV
jgi:hypothetical protein